MSTYTPSTNFAAKDALISGNPLKIVKGTEISAEFTSISSTFTSKPDITATTGSLIVPTGTTAQRDVTPAVGYTRVNSTTGLTEWWNGVAWLSSVNETSATGSVILASGTTAQRDGTPVAGYIRYNTTLSQPEVYNGTAWGSVGGGATGGGADTIFQLNSLVMTTNYTLPTGKNASLVGPLTVNSGVVLTIPSGQRMVVL